MKFYYTGATTYNIAQTFAALSLGGFLSSSEIQNDLLNNLFSNLSQLAKQNLKREAILIALKNTYNETIQDVTFEFNTADWAALLEEYSIAFVASKMDDCSNVYFDKITSSEALPFVTLDILSDTNNSFNIGDFEPGKVIGIWLVRKVLKDKVAPISCNQLYANFLGADYIDPSTGTTYTPAPPPAEESISLVLSWSPDESQSDSV
jgi:hypothetical protein